MKASLDTRNIVEAALLTAITILFCVLDAYIPVFALVYPIPVVVLTVRRGVRSGVLATVVAVLGTSALVGPLQGLTVFSKVGIVGLTLGVCIRRQLSPIRSVLITALAVGVSFGLILGISALAFGFDPRELIGTFEKSLERALDIYRHLGMPERDLKTLEGNLREMVKVARQAFPAIVALALVAVGGINYIITRFVLIRLNYKVEDIPPFSRWRMPWYLGWGYILGVSLMFIGQLRGMGPIFQAGLNVFTLFSYIFLVQGLSVAWFFLDKYRVSKILRYFMVFFVVTTQFFAQLLVWAGLFDAWLDLRKLRQGAV